MKKIFAVLLAAACCASGAFCAGVQLDAFFGGSNGFDAGSVFGSGKLKSTIGVVYESHETEHEEFVHSYFEEGPHSIIEKASYFGPFYKLDYAFDFLKLSDFSLGADVAAQVSFGYDSVHELNFFVALNPAVKASYKSLDFFAGYKGTAFLAEAATGVSFWKNSFSIGVRYNFKSVSPVTTSVESGSGSDYNPSIRIIPGSSIKSVY